MNDQRYFEPHPKGRWSMSRKLNGRYVSLAQDSWLDHPDDALFVLDAIGIATTDGNLDAYFPILGPRGRCPTLEIIELLAHAQERQYIGPHVGV